MGYRSSLTEIIQIIGRATRDAPGKTRARFTNLIAEPAADDPLVVDAINDYLKAIAASLLMEQVLAPRFDFTPKDTGPKPGFDYGEDGYKEGEVNVGVNAQGQDNGVLLRLARHGFAEKMQDLTDQLAWWRITEVGQAILRQAGIQQKAA